MNDCTTHLEERLRADAAAQGGLRAELEKQLAGMRDRAAALLRKPLEPAAFRRAQAAGDAAEAALFAMRRVGLGDDSEAVNRTMELIRR